MIGPSGELLGSSGGLVESSKSIIGPLEDPIRFSENPISPLDDTIKLSGSQMILPALQMAHQVLRGPYQSSGRHCHAI